MGRNIERDEAIVADIQNCFGGADSFLLIGHKYGISRERVRQIARKVGITGEGRKKLRRKSFLDSLRKTGDVLTAAKLAGVSEGIGDKYAREIGMSRRAIHLKKLDQKLAPLIDRVRNGESFYAVSGGNQTLLTALQRACHRVGVFSTHESRNPNFRKVR
jgi:hypothetical protein